MPFRRVISVDGGSNEKGSLNETAFNLALYDSYVVTGPTPPIFVRQFLAMSGIQTGHGEPDSTPT